MTATTLPPAQALLLLLGIITAFGLVFFLFNVVLPRMMSGWNAIAERFPLRDANFTGDTYKQQSGFIGRMQFRRSFDVRFAQEGVCVYPSFARRNPCLIPWSNIRDVSVGDLGLYLAADYERDFQFSLPTGALPLLQSKLPSQLFHASVSRFDLAKKALQDGTLPKWMNPILGGALNRVEKELEKENRKPDDAP